MQRTKRNGIQSAPEMKKEIRFQRKFQSKKNYSDLIQETKNAIDEKFEKNPPIIPNKTLLKWIEVYCPNCYIKIAGKLEKRHLFNPSKDIYHQNFKLILNEVLKFLKQHEYSDDYEWLSREMQNDLLTIEKTL